MVDIPFIQDPTAIQIIQTILDLAGPNYQPPYSGGEQPYRAADWNDELLLQYDQPGGTTSRPTANPATSQSIGTAINTLLMILMPFISAFGLILPILGVIRGIIEIICAMMNPFAVIKAVIRLFVKWIPPFISLFPPLAGVVIIASTIKLILSIVYYILTEVIPTIQLIIDNIGTVIEGIQENNTAKAEGGRIKLRKIITILANKIGVLAVLLPLLEIILLLLGLVAGFPCSGGGTDRANGLRMDITAIPANFAFAADSTCCDDDVCPPEIRNPPSSSDFGPGILLPSFFGELIPGLVFNLFTNNPNVSKLRKYNQSLVDQLNPQLDEEINIACPPGSDSEDCPLFKVKITSRRGGGNSIITNAVRIRGTVITIINPIAITMLGSVDYEIIPNYEILVMRNMIGLACHPDVEAAKNFARPPEDLDTPLSNRLPDATAAIIAAFDNTTRINEEIDRLPAATEALDVDTVTDVQNNLLTILNDYADQLKAALSSTLEQVTNRFNTIFEVDKNLAKADGQDIATLIVIPRDGAGASIAKNLPADITVNVEFITDFGIISNQRLDSATGSVLADLTSTVPGTATITAKINTEFISDKNIDGTETVRERQVRFVADAILPKRRKVSTPVKGVKGAKGTVKSPTGVDSEREPRK